MSLENWDKQLRAIEITNVSMLFRFLKTSILIYIGSDVWTLNKTKTTVN